MSILTKLSASLGLKGNQNEIMLAQEIAASEDLEAISELVENLGHTNRNIQSDCIKVLYETAYLKPQLIAPYYDQFLVLLRRKNNRLIWGSMIALQAIADWKHQELFRELDLLSEIIRTGSVITIDCGLGILARLNVHAAYRNTVEPMLTEQLWKCPVKQLPQYMEKALVCITPENRELYLSLVERRLPECDKESQQKRLRKVLRHMERL